MQKIFGLIKNFRQKTGRWFWIMLAVILIIVWRVIASAGKTTKVQVTQVTSGGIIESVSTSGTVKADQYSALTFPSGGLISWVGVKTGQKVAKGQSIAQLNTVSLNASYQVALSNYRSYQASADSVLDSLKGHSSDETFTQKATRTAAEVARDNAYNAVLAAQDNLRNAVIYAPFAGIIDTVIPSSPGINVLPGAANYTIVNPNSVYFDSEVAETDLSKVSIGQEVIIILDAYPGATFSGKVTTIGMVAFTSGTGGNAYHARISLPINTDMKFKVGMGGDADIVFNKIGNTLKIPVSALVSDSNNYVWIIENGKAKRVDVETGGESVDEVEIKSGLSEGQKIIDNPASTLKAGQRVSI